MSWWEMYQMHLYKQTCLRLNKQGEDRVIMKITGVLVDMFVQFAPELYGPCVVFENGKKTLYVEVIRQSTGYYKQLFYGIANSGKT